MGFIKHLHPHPLLASFFVPLRLCVKYFLDNIYKPIRSFFLSFPLLCFLIFIPFSPSASENETINPIDKAELLYEQGAQERILIKRENLFNQALTLFLKEGPFPQDQVNGTLGNTYFQLGEYPRAILHYYRALQKRPYDQDIRNNLTLAQKKLGVLPEPSPSLLQRILFPAPFEIQLFLLISLILSFLFFSFWIWTRRNHWKRLGITSLLLAIVLFIHATTLFYLSPIEGVVLKSSLLHRGGGQQFAYVSESPVVSGEKVKVISVLSGGQWLKIKTTNGRIGYLHFSSIELIQQ